MISIIICSINPDYLDKVTQNIAATIGVPYELLVKDNRQDNLPICQVYNQQAALAKYDLLLFLHEDVVFHSQQWGQDLVKIFKEVPNIGVVGLAGSAYKSAALSGWYTGVKELDAYRVLHNIAGRHVWLQHSPDENKLLHQAVCVDGVFIATTRENWKNIQFNEAELKGFHFYDLDFSIRTHKQNRAVFIW
ncbi:MAG TPA: glycosyltransferase, partial [Phnomibacter sp.]|nr:glycosyltransferase [Phnomibacter sp.]